MQSSAYRVVVEKLFRICMLRDVLCEFVCFCGDAFFLFLKMCIKMVTE